MEEDMPSRQLVRIKQKGQLTLPARMLRDLGLKEGDMVDVQQTPEGQIVLTPQEVVAMRALDELGSALKKRGITLEELVESGRDIREELAKEWYGLGSDDQQG
jgi:AbrB family looped-hinge helix DNA binding protein